jgi:hypothetical protein
VSCAVAPLVQFFVNFKNAGKQTDEYFNEKVEIRSHLRVSLAKKIWGLGME